MHTNQPVIFSIYTTLLVLLMTAHLALGQKSITGAIHGTLTDPQGALITSGIVTDSRGCSHKPQLHAGVDDVYRYG
jgi:hypothetical protein